MKPIDADELIMFLTKAFPEDALNGISSTTLFKQIIADIKNQPTIRREDIAEELVAVWGMDYDYRMDKCFDRPVCPECETPFGEREDGKYHCFSCGNVIKVEDPEMIKWIEERKETKVEMRDCFVCGGKGTSEDHFIKNDVTKEWQTAWGECKACGARFIV